MQWISNAARIVVGSALLALAATAWGQDYTITTAGVGQYIEQRPAGATQLGITSVTTGTATTTVTLPFEFPYYGRLCSTAVVSAHGMLVLGASGPIANSFNQAAAHGQVSSSVAFPYASTGDVDGLVAVVWHTLYALNDGSVGCGYVYTWTTGAAPNRKFVVSWENADLDANLHPRVTLQCVLSEGSGRIVMAHSGGWGNITFWECGIDAIGAGDARFMVPPGIQNNPGANHAYSGADLVFDPASVSVTGRLLYDRIVSDSSGIGNSVQSNVSMGRCRVELRRDGGIVANAVVAADDGSFSIPALGVASTSSGGAYAVARTAACSVLDGTGATHEWTLNGSLSYGVGASLGTLTLGAGADSGGTKRAAFHVAKTCLAAHDWAAARTSGAIPKLDVRLDAGSNIATHYQSGATPTMRVGTAAAPNPDLWDDAIITKTYARHVLASIAAAQTTTADDRFDAVTDAQNACTEGFGHYLWAAVSGASTSLDGTSSSSATVHDLERPAVTVTKASDVAGCMAGALYDLLDSANETADAVDGTLAPARVFQIVDGFSVCPTAATFLQAWVDAGHSSSAVTRTFVANSVLADDASEPNDDRTEAAALGLAARRSSRVLNRFNEDWYSVTLAGDVAALVADATYARGTLDTVISLEVRNAAGALVTTGVPLGSAGPVRATTGALTAGTYAVGVKYVSGVAIPTYTVQTYEPFSMSPAPFVDWTVGRDYDRSLGVVGGIPPFVFSTPSSALPPGLATNSQTRHVAGVPTTPGSYSVTLQCRDDGDPANVATITQTVVIHDVLKVAVPAFVGFPAGKPIDATLPTTGGTPPLTLTPTGALPSGLAFDAGTFHVTGTASPGSSALALDAVDVAGSADHVATRAVVAVTAGKKVAADLAAGEDACGWWFDAVQGSTVGFSVATAKGRAKRALAGTLLAPDRSVVIGGTIKPKLGALTASKFIAPLSGRYYFVASSTTGDATQLLGTIALAPPKSGKGKLAAFDPDDTTSIEVGALPGATLVLKFAGDKKQQLVAKVLSATNPQDAAVPTGAFVKTNALGGTLTMSLPIGGTWKIRLGATSSTGAPGKLTWSYSVKQPKDVAFSAD